LLYVRIRFKAPKDLIFSWESTSVFAESIGVEPVFDDPDLRRDAASHRERRKAGPASQVISEGMVLRPGTEPTCLSVQLFIRTAQTNHWLFPPCATQGSCLSWGMWITVRRRSWTRYATRM
jgi:hypothetical protein